MSPWFIHYAFSAGYVNQTVPLFGFVSNARVGAVIALLALAMCVPVALDLLFRAPEGGSAVGCFWAGGLPGE